jgi:hypothetical protein
MPLQEISNNYRRIPAKKQVGKVSTKPLSTLTNCGLPLSAQKKESQHGKVQKPTSPTVVESAIQAPRVFLESNKSWGSWVSDDIQFWSENPKFQNEGKTLCCLLCGKKVRGKEGDKELVARHVKGDHHQKVFKIMQNLKQLKDENVQRFDEMIKVVAAPRNSPDASCTLKQRRAFYANVAIQTLARNDPVTTVVSPIRQRFLKDRVQEKPALEVEETPSVEQNPIVHGNCQENIAPGASPSCEHTVEGLILSPLMSKKEAENGIVSTPFPGSRHSEHTKEPDSTVKTVAEQASIFSPSAKSKADANAAPNGVCLSPSSDVSEQSEIGWMGTIDELDLIVDGPSDTYDGKLDADLQQVSEQSEIGWMGTIDELDLIVDGPSDTYDGKLDADLQQLIYDDSRVDGIMFGMPTIKITQVDHDTDVEKGDTESKPLEVTSSMLTFDVAAKNVATRDVTESALDTQRSIECIAALSFAGFL